MEIRIGIEADFAAVRELHLSAFPAADDGDLLDALRRNGVDDGVALRRN